MKQIPSCLQCEVIKDIIEEIKKQYPRNYERVLGSEGQRVKYCSRKCSKRESNRMRRKRDKDEVKL